MSKKIRTIFIGTPDFGIPSLNALIKSDSFEVVAVITQPDKKIGRRQTVTPPPIKVEAEKHGLLVLQPEKINKFITEIQKLKPELAIVVAYAQIISKELLDLPKYGFVNIHGSLLPKYRGAACIQAAIANGDPETGITIMKMDKGLDTGPILEKFSTPITDCDTGGTMFMKLSQLGGEILVSTLEKYISGEIKPVTQDNKQASYVGMLKKQDGLIDWKKDAEKIERHIRAMNPWPGAYTQLPVTNSQSLIIKIIQTEHVPPRINKHKPGKIFIEKNNLMIQCGQDALIINKLQLAGKNIITSEEFLRGYKNLIGAILQ